MNASSQEIALKIESTYKNNSFSLSLKKQYHFFLRLFRITGDKKYFIPILTYQKLRTIETIEMIENKNQKLFLKEKSNELFNALPNQKKKSKKRREIFQKNKQILFYFYLIDSLYQWKTFKISENEFLKKYYQEGVAYLSTIDFEKIIFEKELFLHYSAQLVNQVHYLECLGILTLKKQFIERLQQLFFQQKEKSLDDFKNKLYGLTHLIIVDSDYYQHFALQKKNKWILDYFEKNIERIIEKTTPDIVGEVGLCFKLCRVNNLRTLTKIQQYLISAFDQKRGYIPQKRNISDEKNFQASEHRNIIALMFLKDFKRLYRGPALNNFFNVKFL